MIYRIKSYLIQASSNMSMIAGYILLVFVSVNIAMVWYTQPYEGLTFNSPFFVPIVIGVGYRTLNPHNIYALVLYALLMIFSLWLAVGNQPLQRKEKREQSSARQHHNL
ncbi:hypothetical protein CHT97_09565 [Lacticaseibacillus chiayiensis]|nr:hypothetical protein CHT97_09565 [Lacticaseibacillus chiayiensis]